MKYLKAAIIVLVLLAVGIWLIGSYLGPDDLKGCEAAPSNKAGCEAVDAVVAISGGDTSARANEAIKLYKNGWAPLIIFSGAAADKTGPSNAQVMKEQAIEAGVDPNVVVVEESSETTGQNAAATTTIFAQYKVKSAILVTSAYHERRAVLEFDRRSTGVTVKPHPVAEDKQWSAYWWSTPIGWALAIPELGRSLVLSTGGVDR